MQSKVRSPSPTLRSVMTMGSVFLCGFSDVSKVAIMIQKKYLAKFGYKQDMHVKAIKCPSIFWAYIARTKHRNLLIIIIIFFFLILATINP